MSDVLDRVTQNIDASRLRTIDLDDWLDEGESVTNAVWSVLPVTAPTLAVSNQSLGARDVTAVLSGGVVGTVYCVQVDVTTDGPQTEPFFFEVFIVGDPC